MYDDELHSHEVRREIDQVWSKSLALLSDVINSAELSIHASEKWLNEDNGLTSLVSMGCACVRQARAGLSLCRSGFADEAYSFCRPLWEKQIDIGFILLSGNPEIVLRRYYDWDRAKLLGFGLNHKDGLDKLRWGPGEGWGGVREQLDNILGKYDATERRSVGKGDNWAKLYRDLGSHKKSAILDSFEDRAAAVGNGGTDSQFRWLMYNGAVHMSPRRTDYSFSAPEGFSFVAHATGVGLFEPIKELALTISTVASRFEDDLTYDVVPPQLRTMMKRNGRARVEKVRQLTRSLEDVPRHLK